MTSSDPPANCVTCGGTDKPCECRTVLAEFTALMLRELEQNAPKGGRSSWRTMNPGQAVSELLYHAAKLAVAVRQVQKDPDPRLQLGLAEVQEYAADTANCALMVLDVVGLLGPQSRVRDLEAASSADTRAAHQKGVDLA